MKHSFGIPRIDAGSPQTEYAAFLLLYDAPPLGDEFLGAAKIVFGSHFPNNAQGGENRRKDLSPKKAGNQSHRACAHRGNRHQAAEPAATYDTMLAAGT